MPKYAVKEYWCEQLKDGGTYQYTVTHKCNDLYRVSDTFAGRIQDLELDGFGPDTVNNGLLYYSWAKDINGEVTSPEGNTHYVTTAYVRLFVEELDIESTKEES